MTLLTKNSPVPEKDLVLMNLCIVDVCAEMLVACTLRVVKLYILVVVYCFLFTEPLFRLTQWEIQS